MSDKNMNAKLSVNFTTASNRANIESNENISTSFGKISKYFSDLKTVAFSNSYNDLDNKPDIPDTSNFAPLSSNSYINFTSRGLANTWDGSSRISTEYVHNGTDVAGIDIEVNGTGTDSSGNPVGTPEIQTYVDVNDNGTIKSTHWYTKFGSDRLDITHVGANKSYGTIFHLADAGDGDYIGNYVNGLTPDASLNFKYPTVKINGNVIGAASNTMTGYTKPQATSAITASDTLNQAIGKLEKKLDSSLTTLITTHAVSTSDWTNTIYTGTTANIYDTIQYHNIPTGPSYVMTTQVYNATSQTYLDVTLDGSTGTEVWSVFTPTGNTGSNGINFSVDITGVNVGDVLNVIETFYIDDNTIIATSDIYVIAPKRYGFRIDKNDINPDTRVTYMYDAEGMTPAYMDFTTHEFNYGSWGDVWFVSENRPVALKYDGTVDYELDHTDFTKKLDGTASDVSSTSYAGNFMSEMPTVYVKRWEDSNYNYISFCQQQYDSDYLAQAHTNANGVVNSYIYLPMFKGYVDGNNRLRSLMGTYPTKYTTSSNIVTYAGNCGSGWQIWDKAKIDLIMDLITLITKSTNCRAKIGNGDCKSYNYFDTNEGMMKSGHETDGSTRSTNAQFYGYEGTQTTDYGKHHMIAFYIEDMWANRNDKCLGFNLVDNVYKVKMTPPYTLDSDSTYITLSISPPTPPSSGSGDWLKNMSSGIYGDVPTQYGASSTTGFACYFLIKGSGTKLAIFGGGNNLGLFDGRQWNLVHDFNDTAGSGSPCYSAP